MALPQLAGAGNNNLPMLKDAFSQQDQHGDLLASLVDLTKELVDGQAKLFQKLLLVMDTKKEATEVDSASGSVEGVEEEMTLGVKDLFAGAFIALSLWANELDKYIRTLWLAKTIASLAKIPDSIKAVFTTLGTKIKNTKVFKALATSIDDFLAGFKNIGKIMGAVKTPVAIKEFKTFSGKIGAIVGKITKPIMSAFTVVGDTIKPFVDMFANVLPKLKGIVSKVLLPLFAIFDFVSGFIEGFSSKGEDDTRGTMEKVMDGLFAGAIKLIKGIFIVPLDLLKDGVSWLAEKMGFENFSAALDSFSFNDIFDKFIKFGNNIFSSEPEEGYFSIVKMVGDVIDNIVEFMKGLIPDDIIGSLKKLAGNALDIISSPQRWLWNNAIKPAIDAIIKMFGGSVELPGTGEIGDMATNFLKNILKSVLPNPDAGFIQNLASKAIPNSV